MKNQKKDFYILFICGANFCRSQMAEAVGKQVNETGRFQFDSAGVSAAGRVDSGVIEFLQKRGYDFNGHFSKGLEDVLPLEDYDVVVTLCGEACVVLPELSSKTEHLKWHLEDPTSFVGEQRARIYAKNYEFLEGHIRDLMKRFLA